MNNSLFVSSGAIRPLLAIARTATRGPRPTNCAPIDDHYEAIRQDPEALSRPRYCRIEEQQSLAMCAPQVARLPPPVFVDGRLWDRHTFGRTSPKFGVRLL